MERKSNSISKITISYQMMAVISFILLTITLKILEGEPQSIVVLFKEKMDGMKQMKIYKVRMTHNS